MMISDSFIKSFTGSHHYVLDYLIEEVLEQQPEPIQSFLLQTAVLNRLTGPENTLSHMKHFRVLAHQFRHTVALYDDAFRAVVGIINDRIDRRLNLSIAA